MIYKERMSYYDMDPHTAQLYAPIDEYLKQTKRFSQKAMKKKLIGGIVVCTLLILLLLFFFVSSVKDYPIFSALVIAPFTAVMIFCLVYHIRHYGEKPHMDMLTCEDVLDKDGMENVYRDYSQALRFGKEAVIGRYYLFIKGRTIIRISQITGCDINVVAGEDSVSYYFRVYVNDEFGERYYNLDSLSGSTKKQEKQFAELRSLLETAQKRIEQIDI